MEAPKRPLMAVVGGAKISDKIDILNRFIGIADFVAVGGARSGESRGNHSQALFTAIGGMARSLNAP